MRDPHALTTTRALFDALLTRPQLNLTGDRATVDIDARLRHFNRAVATNMTRAAKHREAAAPMFAAGVRTEVIAQKFGVSAPAVRHWRRMWVAVGNVPPPEQRPALTPVLSRALRLLGDEGTALSLSVAGGATLETAQTWIKRLLDAGYVVRVSRGVYRATEQAKRVTA